MSDCAVALVSTGAMTPSTSHRGICPLSSTHRGAASDTLLTGLAAIGFALVGAAFFLGQAPPLTLVHPTVLPTPEKTVAAPERESARLD